MPRGLDHRRVQPGQPDGDVAHQHQLRVGHQRNDRRRAADAEQWDQQHQQRQAGDRVDHPQHAQHRAAQPANARQQHTQWHRDRQSNRRRDGCELEVLDEPAGDCEECVDQVVHTVETSREGARVKTE
jgi:hypothetical protein